MNTEAGKLVEMKVGVEERWGREGGGGGKWQVAGRNGVRQAPVMPRQSQKIVMTARDNGPNEIERTNM